MDCQECSSPNSKNASFCEICGEPLTALASAARRKRELREKRALEIELTEAVTARLMRWAKIFTTILAVPTAILIFFLGKGVFDIQKSIEAGQSQIERAAKQGKEDVLQSIGKANGDVTALQKQLPIIGSDIKRLQSDITAYRQVNEHINQLQAEVSKVQTDIIDLGQKTLKAKVIETSGPRSGSGTLSLSGSGCTTEGVPAGSLSLCVQGNPATFNVMTSDGQSRPIASISDAGFQDTSTHPKKNCNAEARGTFWVEKGLGQSADKALVCMKRDAGNYSWQRFTTVD